MTNMDVAAAGIPSAKSTFTISEVEEKEPIKVLLKKEKRYKKCQGNDKARDIKGFIGL